MKTKDRLFIGILFGSTFGFVGAVLGSVAVLIFDKIFVHYVQP